MLKGMFILLSFLIGALTWTIAGTTGGANLKPATGRLNSDGAFSVAIKNSESDDALFWKISGEEDSPATVGQPLALGQWAGHGIRLDVTKAGTTVELDCAHGSFDAKPELDNKGRFKVAGTYITEGGPAQISTAMQGAKTVTDPNAKRAHYAGTVRGKTMTLVITIDHTPPQSIGTFQLKRGAIPRLEKCY